MSEGIITIQLIRQSGINFETIVDCIDGDLASITWWSLRLRNKLYAHCEVWTNGTRKHKLLHRIILERMLRRPLEQGEQVDHINGNGLDNRRINLRLATRNQNLANRIQHSNSKQIYKGIEKRGNKYRARITVNGNRLHLGYFDTPEEAHDAYCEAAKEYFGEFANFG